MSFVQADKGILAKDVWPDTLKAAIQDPRKVDELEAWQVVPDNFEDICDWAHVAPNRHSLDPSRPHLVLYRHPSASIAQNSTLYPVTIRLQGFLGRFELASLGNWNGDPTKAVSATQHLCLSNKGLLPAWTAGLNAINHVKLLIRNTTDRHHRHADVTPNTQQELFIQRRVFAKVHAQGSDAPLVNVDDPNGWLPKVANQWAVRDVLQIGRMLDNGHMAACSPMALNVGDFIDVGVSFEVAVTRSFNGQRRIHIHLVLSHVLQLMPVRKVNELKIFTPPRPVLVREYSSPPADKVVPDIVQSGLVFPAVSDAAAMSAGTVEDEIEMEEDDI